MASTALRILMVEDTESDAMLFEAYLKNAAGDTPMRIVRADTFSAAIAALADEPRFDCVLLDLNLPDGMGVGNVSQLLATSPHATIVVMTGLHDEAAAYAALKLGAQEFVIKNSLDGDTLLRVIRHAIQRHAIIREIEQQREQAYVTASRDALTGLLSRAMFEEITETSLARSRRSKERLALCFMDLDGFKPINDQLGHAEGDKALVAVADALRAAVRDQDIVSRVGGDEFAVLLQGVGEEGEDSAQRAGIATARMLANIEAIELAQAPELKMSASIGVSLSPDHGRAYQQLLINADMAMYAAKKAGGRRTTTYSKDMRGVFAVEPDDGGAEPVQAAAE